MTLIEQPEIHLHPKMQADLADLFIDIVISKNQKQRNQKPSKYLFIETHSEYLLKRLRRRISDGTISADNVAIYLIDPDLNDEGATIRELEVQERGQFDWPIDFYGGELLKDSTEFIKNQQKYYLIMACYTLSNCILQNLVAGKKYITDLLMVFTQESNPFKVALDKSNRIIELYETAGQTNEYVANWLSLMSYQPANFETINIDTSTISNIEEIFLKVCSKTNSQQKLIVHSHEGWQNFSYQGEKVIFLCQ